MTNVNQSTAKEIGTAIKGLKAIQKEAKKATQALKEQEQLVNELLEPKESIGHWIYVYWKGSNLVISKPMQRADALHYAKQIKEKIADRDHFCNRVWLFQQREEI